MAETWANCPLMLRYEQAKRAYMKEMRLEQWKKEQRNELWNAIRITFAEIHEPKKEYWMQRLYGFYCHRFYWHTKTGWLEFLGELNDEQAYGKYRQEKAKYYCCLVRNTAWWMTHPTVMENAKACEPICIFEKIRLAA